MLYTALNFTVILTTLYELVCSRTRKYLLCLSRPLPEKMANPWEDDSGDEGEGDGFRKSFEDVRDNVVFLVDVQPDMVREPPGGLAAETALEDDEQEERQGCASLWKSPNE